MTAQKKVLRAIFEGTWSQLDPDHQAAIAQHRNLIDEVMEEMLSGPRRLRIIQREESRASPREEGTV